jgi:hypothetical protein
LIKLTEKRFAGEASNSLKLGSPSPSINQDAPSLEAEENYINPALKGYGSSCRVEE